MAGWFRKFRQKTINEAAKKKKNKFDKEFPIARDDFLATGPAIKNFEETQAQAKAELRNHHLSKEMQHIMQSRLRHSTKRLKELTALEKTLTQRLQIIEFGRTRPKSTGMLGLVRYLTAAPKARRRLRNFRRIRSAKKSHGKK